MEASFVLLAQAAVQVAPHSLSTFDRMITAIPWFAWIPILAIVCGSITEMVKRSYRHSERMAMIRMGMHPDAVETRSSCLDGKPDCPEVAEL